MTADEIANALINRAGVSGALRAMADVCFDRAGEDSDGDGDASWNAIGERLHAAARREDDIHGVYSD